MAFMVIAFLMCLFIIWRDDNPAYKIAWILTVCLFPILGVTMYVFFGNKRPSRPLKRKIEPMEKLHRSDLVQKDELKEITSGKESEEFDLKYRQMLNEYETANNGYERYSVTERW